MQIDPVTVDRVIEADGERLDQAYWLAYCELGTEPSFETEEEAHRAYSRRLTERAAEIFARLN